MTWYASLEEEKREEGDGDWTADDMAEKSRFSLKKGNAKIKGG